MLSRLAGLPHGEGQAAFGIVEIGEETLRSRPELIERFIEMADEGLSLVLSQTDDMAVRQPIRFLARVVPEAMPDVAECAPTAVRLSPESESPRRLADSDNSGPVSNQRELDFEPTTP